MRVLGLGGLDHNGALALLEDGRPLAFVECERVVRDKNIGLDRLDVFERTLAALDGGPVDAIGVADLHFWRARRPWLEPALEARFPGAPRRAVHHHRAHAYAALAASPFDRATCVTLDGKGDGSSASAALLDRRGGLERLMHVPSASSLGRLWWAVSEYCGLPGHHSAGKVMALAALGTPDDLWGDALRLHDDGGFAFDPGAGHADTFREVPRIVRWLEARVGRPAGRLDADVAASVQALTERIVCHAVGRAVARSGERRVCFAGGVALNGLANQRLLADGVVDALFVPPCTDDRGLALGAAAAASVAHGVPLVAGAALSPFLGPPVQGSPGPGWRRVDTSDADHAAAALIASGALVAVCRGRDEAGPRALGHRSLLASPTVAATRDHINREVKRREPFRPFGCALPLAAVGDWFDLKGPSPYMLRIATVRPDRAAQIPAVLHADDTSRIQTVTADDGSGLWPILQALDGLGQPPVVLNTSLNRRGEPLVHTVEQAANAARAMGVGHLLTDVGLFRDG